MLWRLTLFEWVWSPLFRWCVLPPCSFLVFLPVAWTIRRISIELTTFYSTDSHSAFSRSFGRIIVLWGSYLLLLPSLLRSMFPVSLHPLSCLFCGSPLAPLQSPATVAVPIDWWLLFVSVFIRSSTTPSQSRGILRPEVSPTARPARLPNISSAAGVWSRLHLGRYPAPGLNH